VEGMLYVLLALVYFGHYYDYCMGDPLLEGELMYKSLVSRRGQNVWKIRLLPYLPREACRELWDCN
jgi:hypothetical protein